MKTLPSQFIWYPYCVSMQITEMEPCVRLSRRSLQASFRIRAIPLSSTYRLNISCSHRTATLSSEIQTSGSRSQLPIAYSTELHHSTTLFHSLKKINLFKKSSEVEVCWFDHNLVLHNHFLPNFLTLTIKQPVIYGSLFLPQDKKLIWHLVVATFHLTILIFSVRTVR